MAEPPFFDAAEVQHSDCVWVFCGQNTTGSGAMAVNARGYPTLDLPGLLFGILGFGTCAAASGTDHSGCNHSTQTDCENDDDASAAGNGSGRLCVSGIWRRI